MSGMESGSSGPLRVLVVDDSAVFRQVMTSILTADGIDVTAVSDPVFALDRMARSRPHVILLDMEMPRMDGLTFLRRIMAEDPLPVVVCSGFTGRGTAKALEALREGAVEVLAKPQLDIRHNPRSVTDLILRAVRAASRARVGRPGRAAPTAAVGTAAPGVVPSGGGGAWIVAIGASTGGTEALRRILAALPANAPPILIVQHMPAAFTAAFADALDADCKIAVREAKEGDAVTAGTALIAPGGEHMRLVCRGTGLAVAIVGGPPVSLHRPSVDVLFQSVAAVTGPRQRTMGVLLTGMGADGAAGLLAMRRAGAHTVAQDEESSVVFGMPREAILLNAAAEVLPLHRIAGALCAPRFPRAAAGAHASS